MNIQGAKYAIDLLPVWYQTASAAGRSAEVGVQFAVNFHQIIMRAPSGPVPAKE
jgi:hypothetical protein